MHPNILYLSFASQRLAVAAGIACQRVGHSLEVVRILVEDRSLVVGNLAAEGRS